MRGWARPSRWRRSAAARIREMGEVLGTGLILSPTQFPYERRQRRPVSATSRAAVDCRSAIYIPCMADAAVDDQPAVDQELVAGDVPCRIRSEEDGRVGNLLGRGDVTEGDTLLVRAPDLGCVGTLVEGRVRRAGRERVDGDAVLSELERERLRQPDNAALR